jgi:polyisoprenoid-binding protein YceI
VIRPLHRIALLLVATASVASAASAQATTWNIDPNHSAAQFAVKHLLVSTVRGQFDKMSGTIQLTGNDVRTMAVNVTIDPASVDTRVTMRDNDLRSANFFDVATYPTITFVSKKAEPVDATHFKLTGDLTMHGVTREVVLAVESSGQPLTQGTTQRLGATATTTINRHDFNLHYNRAVEGAAVVGDDIVITIDLEATHRS